MNPIHFGQTTYRYAPELSGKLVGAIQAADDLTPSDKISQIIWDRKTGTVGDGQLAFRIGDGHTDPGREMKAHQCIVQGFEAKGLDVVWSGQEDVYDVLVLEKEDPGETIRSLLASSPSASEPAVEEPRESLASLLAPPQGGSIWDRVNGVIA